MKRETLKKIIELTASIYSPEEVWGKDTIVGTLKDLECDLDSILKEAGYVSPNECKKCEKAWIDSERILFR